MRNLAQSAVTISVAAAFLGGCGGSQPLIGAPGAMPQNHTGVRARIVTDRVRTASSSYQVLYSFTGSPDGANPTASLVLVKGVLYGTTIHGGRHRGNVPGPGTVFSIATTGAEHVLHGFSPFVSGKTPYANVIGVSGILYGTTFVGGKHGGGTIFSLRTTGKLHVLHSFGYSSNAGGANPTAGLINVSGTLYGTTLHGGNGSGTVFSITQSGTEQVLHRFDNGSDGKQPKAALVTWTIRYTAQPLPAARTTLGRSLA